MNQECVFQIYLEVTEAGTYRCSYEKVFWKYAANVLENTHAEVRTPGGLLLKSKNFPSYLINRFYENILISQYRHSQPGIFCIHFESFMRILTSCCCGYHYCTTSFKQILNSGSGHGQTGDSRRWGSLTTVPVGNKAKRLSLVNHTTKAVHHHHHHQSFLLYFYIV